MSIILLLHPTDPPTAQTDYTDQNNLIAASFLDWQPVKKDVSGDVPKGSVFQSQGKVFKCTSDTSISGTPSSYIKLVENGAGDELNPEYVANLTGVTWDSDYNGYYDTSNNLHVFDEFEAYLQNEISVCYTLLGQSLLDFNDKNIFYAEEYYATTGDLPSAPAVTTWLTRDLNRTQVDNLPGASLSSNQITLPAGKYEIEFWSPGSDESGHQARLYDTTGAAVLFYGTSGAGYSSIPIDSHGYSQIELSIESVLELQHYFATSSQTVALGYGFQNEIIFARIKITRIE